MREIKLVWTTIKRKYEILKNWYVLINFKVNWPFRHFLHIFSLKPSFQYWCWSGRDADEIFDFYQIFYNLIGSEFLVEGEMCLSGGEYSRTNHYRP